MVVLRYYTFVLLVFLINLCFYTRVCLLHHPITLCSVQISKTTLDKTRWSLCPPNFAFVSGPVWHSQAQPPGGQCWFVVRGLASPTKIHSRKPLTNCEIIMTHHPTLTLFLRGGQNQRLGPCVQGRSAWQYLGITRRLWWHFVHTSFVRCCLWIKYEQKGWLVYELKRNSLQNNCNAENQLKMRWKMTVAGSPYSIKTLCEGCNQRLPNNAFSLRRRKAPKGSNWPIFV